MTKFSAIALALAVSASCSKKDNKDAPAPAPTPAAPTPAPAKPAPTPEPKASAVKVDPEIARLVKEIVAKCEIQPDTMYVSCNGNEAYAVVEYAAKNKLSNTYESLAEIALTDGAKDPKVRAAVVGTWNTFRDRDLQKQNSTPAAADRVLALYPQAINDSFAYAAGIPLIAGKRAELTAVLDKLPLSTLKTRSIEYYLDWGGIAALPDVQHFYETATDDKVRASAARSVGFAFGGLLSPHPIADADKTKLCDWAKSIATDAKTETTSKTLGAALDALGKCSGTYIDDALAVIQTRLAAAKLNETLADSLHHTCWAEGIVGGTPNGTKEQCAKAFGILEKALGDKTIDKSALQSGIFTAEFLGKNSPDLKPKAVALVSRFASNKDVAPVVKDTLARLQKK
jgi:hypothetical protein